MAVAYLANPGRRQATELADKPGRHHQIKGVLREAVFSVWMFFSCGIPQGGCAIRMICFEITITYMTQGKIDLRNESGRPKKVKVVGEVSEK